MSHTLQQPGSQPGSTFYDPLGARLRWAIIASLLVNMLLWRAAASVARNPPHYDLRPVEITRVVIDKQNRKIEKKITPQQIKKKVEQVRKKIEPPKPKPAPTRVVHRTPPKPAPKPPGAHNRVLLAKADKVGPSKPDDHTALAGGNAEVGKPTDAQNAGDAKTNTPEVVKPAPAPTAPVKEPEPKPMPVAPTPAPVTPKPEPHVETPAPEPAPVKPRGPTRDAQPDPDSEVKPEIPDDLKHGDYSAFVRVRVEVEADGTFTATIYKSSGNSDIDDRVMKALEKWKWKPALRNGVPVSSVQRFKFEFLVQ